MKTPPSTHSLVYFGKLPCRGDFVRSATSPSMIQSLDRWLSSGVELMAEDAHWKQMYDQAPSARFVMLGSQRTTAVAGYLIPSEDSAGRRFPFLVAATLELEPDRMGLSPLLLQPVWSRLATLANAACDKRADAATVLADLNIAEAPAPSSSTLASDDYRTFLERTTLVQLGRELHVADGAGVDFRQALLALGLLLQPLLSSGPQPVDKALDLPLPSHEPYRSCMAAFWMELVTAFIARTSHDVSMFMPEAKSRLLIGFSAGSAAVLHGLLDERAMSGASVALASSAWVEDCLAGNYGLKKLSSYLQLPQMSLDQVSKSFHEAFLGS
jgi:type VI secretion system protein ImpM